MKEFRPWQTTEKDRSGRQWSKAKLRVRMYAMMALTDIAALTLGFWFTTPVRAPNVSPAMAFEQLTLVVPLFIAIGLLNQAYSPAIIHDRWGSVGKALKALALSSGAIILVAFSLKVTSDWSRLTFFLGVGLSAFLISVCRYLFVRHANALLGGDPYQIVTIFDGGRPQWTSSGEHREILIQSSDVFEPSKLSPATYDAFSEAIQDADRVIVHCDNDKRYIWTMALKGANVQGEVIAPELGDIKPLAIGHYNDVPTLVVSRGPLALRDRLTKRIFDIAIAGSVLFLLAPVLLIVAAIIYLQDRGPVFFVQVRVGRSNRLFKILKFRSMYVESCDLSGDQSASKTDNRITPFGRFIRSTSIDEFPQLINVLKGDMSIVGPRPHALGSTAENELFWHIDQRYWHRHVIKPGLTGLAQVRGFRGATNKKSDLINRLQSDLEYLNRWTVWRDVLILIRTFGVVLHKNAY